MGRIIRIVTQKDDDTKKIPGRISTEIIEINRRYLANDIKEVWNQLDKIIPEDEELIAIIDENPIFSLINVEKKEFTDNYILGYFQALEDYSVDKDGIKVIGSMNRNIEEIKEDCKKVFKL